MQRTKQPGVLPGSETVAELLTELTEPPDVELEESEPSDIDLGISLVVFKCRRCNWDSDWMRRPSCDLTPPACPHCSKGIPPCPRSSSQENQLLSPVTNFE